MTEMFIWLAACLAFGLSFAAAVAAYNEFSVVTPPKDNPTEFDQDFVRQDFGNVDRRAWLRRMQRRTR
jgi:hypothetical protein